MRRRSEGPCASRPRSARPVPAPSRGLHGPRRRVARGSRSAAACAGAGNLEAPAPAGGWSPHLRSVRAGPRSPRGRRAPTAGGGTGLEAVVLAVRDRYGAQVLSTRRCSRRARRSTHAWCGRRTRSTGRERARAVSPRPTRSSRPRSGGAASGISATTPRDQHPDRAGHAGLPRDQSPLLQGEDHPVPGRWAHLEIVLHLGLEGCVPVEGGVRVQEGEVAPLRLGEARVPHDGARAFSTARRTDPSRGAPRTGSADPGAIRPRGAGSRRRRGKSCGGPCTGQAWSGPARAS
jgi:hypothetical protein